MESCYGGMSTRLKQRAMTEFLSAENVTPAEIHRRLQTVYGENTVNRTTVNRWAIKFRECEPGRAKIVDQPRSGRPVSVTHDNHQKQVDELVKHDRRITQKQIAGRIGMSKERVGYIIGLLGYTKVCSRWVPRMLNPEVDAEVWGSLPSALQPWLGAKQFPFLSSPQEGSQGDSFHLKWWSEASCDVMDQTKNSWILHWQHA